MLTRILNTSGIDVNDPEIQRELKTDLRRMDSLRHEHMPKGVNAYKVTATPSTVTYMLGLHRFKFKIQYGCIDNNKFEPKGEPVFYQTETLPMI